MPSLLQVGIFGNFVGFVLDTIGVMTNHWYEGIDSYAGLFKICDARGCYGLKYYGRFKTMQFGSCLAFLVLLVVSIMAAVFLCKATLRANAKYIKALGILMIIGGSIGFIAAMCGARKGASWSLGVAATGSIVSGIAGILVLLPSNTVTVAS